jgi:hypothetical protein
LVDDVTLKKSPSESGDRDASQAGVSAWRNRSGTGGAAGSIALLDACSQALDRPDAAAHKTGSTSFSTVVDWLLINDGVGDVIG